MASPIKAFLGKSYTKNGITKSYLYNPASEKWGWYNSGQYATDYGRELFRDYADTIEKTLSGNTKASILRDNIKTVLTESADHNIEGMNNLLDAIYDKIDSMSDYEIDQFSEYNKKSISLYFEYKDVTDAGVDARIINIAKSLNIDIYDYIENDSIPSSVQTILDNINEYVRFDANFDNVDTALGRKK